jgi:hypothetical protein
VDKPGFFTFLRYSSGCRSPPSVLVFFTLKNQNGGLKNEKDKFAGLLPVL